MSLPSGVAEWILDLVARGVFADPAHAAFVILGEQHDLKSHADLRREILNDRAKPRSTIWGRPLSEQEVGEEIRKLGERLLAEPAVWVKADHAP